MLKCIKSYLVLYAGRVSTIILFEFKRHIILSGCRLKFKLCGWNNVLGMPALDLC